MRENLLRFQKEGEEENAAYILMQRIFPKVSNMFLVREGVYHKDQAISELGVYGAYLRYRADRRRIWYALFILYLIRGIIFE